MCSLLSYHYFCFAVIALASTTTIFAQTTPSPLSVEQTADLTFPKVAATSNATGTVSIDAISGTVSSTGSITLVSINSSRAELRITGEPGQLVSVRLPNNLDLTSPVGDRLKIQKIEHDGVATLRLGPSGTAILHLGATLRITGNARSGLYRGRMTAAIDYVFE
jgi:Domain of unknown function (DUF4402)